MAVKKAQMMPTFNYEGIDRKGAKIKGNCLHVILPSPKLLCANKGLPSRVFEKRKRIFLKA